MALVILGLLFGGFLIWKAYKYIDAFGDNMLGEEGAFITDINSFLMYWTCYIWIVCWLYKLLAIALGFDYHIFSETDLWMVSIIFLTFCGGVLSHNRSKIFGWISLLLIFWPVAWNYFGIIRSSFWFSVVLAAILLSTFLWTSGKSFQEGFIRAFGSKENNPDPEYTEHLNRSGADGLIDYRAFVDSVSVRPLAIHIASDFTEGSSATLLQAAALFEYVKNNVEYMSDQDLWAQSDYVATPSETLEMWLGDCDDQAVLMASLLSAVGIKNRMLLIGNKRDEWHLATEFCIEASMKDTFEDVLNKFYKTVERSVNPPKKYWCFEEQDGIWLLADTTRDSIADYESLLVDTFLYQTGSKITWNNLQSTH
jgi:hypothetical protein